MRLLRVAIEDDGKLLWMPADEYLMSKAVNTLREFFGSVMMAIRPVVDSLWAAFWDEYRRAGCPFGETDTGMIAWVKLDTAVRARAIELEEYRAAGLHPPMWTGGQ